MPLSAQQFGLAPVFAVGLLLAWEAAKWIARTAGTPETAPAQADERAGDTAAAAAALREPESWP